MKVHACMPVALAVTLLIQGRRRMSGMSPIRSTPASGR